MNEWDALTSPYITFFIVALVITCFYTLFLIEAKKKNNMFEHSIWGMMPKICAAAGVISVVLFIVGGTVGPIMNWVAQWPFLLHVFLIYFLFLIFLFIFSFEHKRQRFKQRSEKTIHISYICTLVLFFVLFIVL